jgi:hypothetical protein
LIKELYLAFDSDYNQNQNYILITDAQKESDIKYSLSPYFEKSHRLSSFILKEEYKNKFGIEYDPLIMSLYKTYYTSCILPICQLLLVAQKFINEEQCIVRINSDSIDISKKIATHLKILERVKFNKPKLKFKRYIFFPKIVYKLLIYSFNSIFVKQDSEIKQVLLCFGSDRFIAPYYSENSIVYPIYNSSNKFSDFTYNNKVVPRKFISFLTLICFIPNLFKLIIKGYKVTNSFSISLEQSLNIAIEVLLCLSLRRKYKKTTHLIGTFDASSSIDATTCFVNNYEIKTVIVPHGLPYTFKSPYLSYGANYYCTWSKFHSKILKRNKFLEEKCEIIVTGNPIYSKMHLHHLRNYKTASDKINLLMILENIPDDFCRSSPYQSIYFEYLISAVVSTCKSYSNASIKIRTRNKDKVYGISKNFKKDVIISIGTESPIEDDIAMSNIVITQYSNAINEALIFGKMIIQVDLFQINDWHTEISNVKRVTSIKNLKIVLESLLKNRTINTIQNESLDLDQFNNCNHNKFESENY